MLEVNNLTVKYADFTAISGVSFNIIMHVTLKTA